MLRRRLFPLLVAVLSFAAVRTISASTFVVPTDRELIRRADAIVIGSALSSYSRLNADNGIETVTVLSVEETIKGDAAGTIDIVEPGGEFEHRATVLAGVPRFEEGKRVLLLLSRTGPNRWAVTQLVLGKFTYESDVAGRRLLVRDEPGVIASISETLAEAGVSIDSFLQKPAQGTGAVPIVLTTHFAPEATIASAD